MSELRHSIWQSMIAPLKREIADIGELEQWTEPRLRDELVSAMLNLPSMGNAATKAMLYYNFAPRNEDGGIRDDLYENYSNIVTDYYLALDTPGTVGYLETKAIPIIQKQPLLINMYWIVTGATSVPTLDVSLNKDPDNGENLVGTFLVNDGRLSAIANGVAFDTSMIPCSSFSFKWSFATDSDYEVKETVAELFLVDTLRMNEEMSNIIKMAAINIYKLRVSEAIQGGGSGQFIESLERKINYLVQELQGSVGKGVVFTSSVGSVEHTIDRNRFASRAFDKKKSYLDGQWVEVTGTEITGKRIRVII